MDNLGLVVAIGMNNEIGLNNDLLWHLKEDMKFFKELTTNNTIIMGRKTFESLPNLLPNRKHIVLTNNKEYINDNVLVLHTKSDVLDYVKNTNELCFIIGGSSIYKLFIDECKYLYITEIESSKNADTYFPIFDKSKYTKELIKKVEGNINYNIYKYTKI